MNKNLAYVCGCMVTRECEDDDFEHGIIFCPLHQLASEYLETIRWMAQTIHQAYHREIPGTFLECTRNTCDAAKQAIQKARKV
jgi:hypothetical protein